MSLLDGHRGVLRFLRVWIPYLTRKPVVTNLRRISSALWDKQARIVLALFQLTGLTQAARGIERVAAINQGVNWTVGALAFRCNELVRRSGVSRVDTGKAIRHHPTSVQAILGRSCSAADVRAAADKMQNFGSLTLVHKQWITKNLRGDAEDAEWFYNRVVLDGPASLGSVRLIFLLSIVDRVALALPEAQAKAILNRLLVLARQSVDPYRPSGAVRAARSAISGLLAKRPELDAALINAVNRSDQSFPQILTSAGVALRNRSEADASSLANFAVAWKLDDKELAALAAKASTDYVRDPVALGSQRGGRYSSRVYDLGRALLPVLAILVIAPLAASFLLNHLLREPSVSLEPAGALTLLALTVTANVFVVQLSTNRLPGLVARVVGQPWQLKSCYTAIALMLLCTFRKPVEPSYAMFTEWLGLAALACFLLSLTLAIPTMLSKTDEARAVKTFAARRIPRFKAVGAKFGSLQGASNDTEDYLKSFAAVRSSGSSVPGERAQVVRTSRRGYLLPSRRAVKDLLDRPEFRSGMQLRTASQIGLVVERGGVVASLIPGADQQVDTRLRRQAARAMKVRSSQDMEEVSSALVTLFNLAIRLNAEGDVGTAASVGEEATKLLRVHMAAARRTRTNYRDREGPTGADAPVDNGLPAGNPIIAASRDCAGLLLRARLEVSDQRQHLLDQLIRSLLASGDAEDLLGAALMGWLPPEVGEHECGALGLTSVARSVGIRALETRDSFLLDMTTSHLRRLAASEQARTFAVENLVILCSISIRFDQWQTKRILREVWVSGLQHCSPEENLRANWVVGGAAIASRAFSVMEDVRKFAVQQGFSGVLSKLGADETKVRGEEFKAKTFGYYLGDYGADALANFSRYVEKIESLTPAAGTHSQPASEAVISATTSA